MFPVDEVMYWGLVIGLNTLSGAGDGLLTMYRNAIAVVAITTIAAAMIFLFNVAVDTFLIVVDPRRRTG